MLILFKTCALFLIPVFYHYLFIYFVNRCNTFFRLPKDTDYRIFKVSFCLFLCESVFWVKEFLQMSIIFDSPVIFRRPTASCVGMQNPYHVLGFPVGISGRELSFGYCICNCQFLQRKPPVSKAFLPIHPNHVSKMEKGGWASQPSVSYFACDLSLLFPHLTLSFYCV